MPLKIKILMTIILCALLTVTACPRSSSKQPDIQPPQKAAPQPKPEPKIQTSPDLALTVFFTGNTLSTIKPCGCSQGQLGGFDRRKAVLDTAKPQKRLIIDTGNMLRDYSEQDLIKFDIIIQALSALNYDLVNLTAQDLDVARQLDLLAGMPFSTITSSEQTEDQIPLSFTREFQLDHQSLFVTVVSLSETSEQFNSPEELFPEHPNHLSLNILILSDCNEDIVDFVRDFDFVDVIVCPAQSDEPEILPDQTDKPLLITAGKIGKYVGRLDIVVQDEKLMLDYSKLAVDETLPLDPNLDQLYKYYQSMVKQADLLARVPKVPLPNDLEYLGSRSCKVCHVHEYEFEKWSTKGHAKAYKTLVDVGSQYDPECVQCHVVGLDYETGFESEDSQEDLRNVGCEVCHGPGSRHMIAVTLDEPDKRTTDPKLDCTYCHTPEHSAGYQGHEEEYREKVKHWREPLLYPPVQK